MIRARNKAITRIRYILRFSNQTIASLQIGNLSLNKSLLKKNNLKLSPFRGKCILMDVEDGAIACHIPFTRPKSQCIDV